MSKLHHALRSIRVSVRYLGTVFLFWVWFHSGMVFSFGYGMVFPLGYGITQYGSTVYIGIPIAMGGPAL